MKKNTFSIERHVLPIVLVISAALYPVIFMYGQNAAEVDFSEVISVAGIFTGIGLILYAVFMLIFKSPYKAGITAATLTLFGTNYMFFQKAVNLVFAGLKYWHIVPICIFVIAHILYFIFKKLKEETLSGLVKIASLIMVFMLLINIIPAAPAIVQKMENRANESQLDNGSHTEGQPNIYWFIFDECASFPVIQEHYGYMDTTVYDHLISNGFFISDSSRNESGGTDYVITNILNLEYVVNTEMTLAELEAYRIDPAMLRVLSENNYSIRGIGDTAWLNVASVTTQGVSGGQTVEGYNAAQLILQNTLIAPFIAYDGTADAKVILDGLNFFKDSKNIIPDNSQFNLSYICSPHQPFLFDENGDSVAANNYNNWSDPQYYLGQYIFVMNEMSDIVDNILKNDPNSVIVVQSDHGPRFKDGMTFVERTNVLNAVYFQNKSIDEIDGTSGVNTWRIIFNRLFNTNYKEVIVPYEG